VVERYFWFRSRLHFHAHQGFTPLDVSTVFLRTDVVRAAGGWDGGCVAENCELGVRLSVDGVTTAVAYEPELATRKLCPETTRDLLRQQTRSIQGFLQVARAGVWRRLPERRQRLLARATLLRPLVEALTGVAVGGVLAGAVLGGAPLVVTVLALVAVVPLVMTVAVEMAGLAELRRTHGSGIGWRDQLRLVWSALPYWTLSAIAAVRALVAYRRSAARAPVGAMAGAADEVTEGAAAGLGGSEPVTGLGVIDLTAGETGAGVAADARAIAARSVGSSSSSTGSSGSPSSSSRAGAAAGAARARPATPPGWDEPLPPPPGGRRRGQGRGLWDTDEGPEPAHRFDDLDDEDQDAGEEAGVEAPTWPTGWSDPPPDPDVHGGTVIDDDPVQGAQWPAPGWTGAPQAPQAPPQGSEARPTWPSTLWTTTPPEPDAAAEEPAGPTGWTDPPTWPTGWTDPPPSARRAAQAEPVGDDDVVDVRDQGEQAPDEQGDEEDPYRDVPPPPVPRPTSAVGPGVIPTGRRKPVWTDDGADETGFERASRDR
jgi:hypothetical protein